MDRELTTMLRNETTRTEATSPQPERASPASPLRGSVLVLIQFDV
jgi:hypothetical protein